MTRVVLLTEIPAPYRIPLFNALAERVDLRVLFLAARQPERLYQLHAEELRYDWDVLPGVELHVGRRWVVMNRGLVRRLRAADALLLGGWNQPAFWEALAYGRVARTPTYVWVESTLHDSPAGTNSLSKRVFARSVAGALVPGKKSAEYVRALAPATDLTVAPNAVDNILFASRVADRDALRVELGLDRCTFLYVGRLSPEKGVKILVRAFADVEDATLVVAGAGPDEAALRAAAPDSVRFLGNLERDDLPRWYAAADAVVVPSLADTWGMALNEGAAAGLPLVAADGAGGAWELVEDGVNGLRVPSGDVSAMAEALRRLVADDVFRRDAGLRSAEIATRFTAEAWADAVVQMLRAAT
ncbi:MAG TPA: glycosyltransferase family 4 protein [Gaiellaceae bacterium]|nr:glycosyltransferase family 4 protein [Gaiellaceae bacterium]